MEIYFVAKLVTGFLPLCYGQILFFLKFELHYGVLPSDWFSVSNPETNRFPTMPPVLFRLLWRGGMLAVWLFLGQMFIGFSVFTLFSLVSAITAAAFSFYLPYVFAWIAFGSELSARRKAMYALFIAVSLAFSGIGIYTSAAQIASFKSAKLFDFEGTCSSAGFFMGQWKSNNYAGNNGGYSHATGNGTFHDTFYRGACGGNGYGGNLNCGQACSTGFCCWNKDRTGIDCPLECKR